MSGLYLNIFKIVFCKYLLSMTDIHGVRNKYFQLFKKLKKVCTMNIFNKILAFYQTHIKHSIFVLVSIIMQLIYILNQIYKNLQNKINCHRTFVLQNVDISNKKYVKSII